MKSSLRILHLEDDPRDAELVQETLETDGIRCHVTRVETEADFIASLEQGGFDLILADYTLPSFDGLSALKIAQQAWPHVPFIFVSGTLGEEVAIEALKIGATDYVFKTRLSRIVPSVRRALREAEERAELSRAEEALRRSEAYLAEAQKLSHTGSFGWDVSSGKIYWSEETFRIFEVEPATQPTLERVFERVHPEDRQLVRKAIDSAAQERKDFDFEHRLLMPDGSVKFIRTVSIVAARDEPRGVEFVGAVTDITERKRAEADLRKALDEIKKLRDQLYKENIALREEIDKASMFEEIVGESPALQAVLARVAKVAPTDSTVLITGETGTGKELIARAIHKRSRRSSRAFVSVNCAATPATLVASELFGHEKGAFTGALQRRLGRFELAEGGTIFLDEVGELPAETQIALLRVLAGAGIRARWRKPADSRGRAGDCRHQSRPGECDLWRRLSKRSLLPPERIPHRDAASPRTEGRHPHADRVLHPPLFQKGREENRDHREEDPGAAEVVCLAGKHSRTAERDRTIGHRL